MAIVATRLVLEGVFGAVRKRIPQILAVPGQFADLDLAVRRRIDVVVTSGSVGMTAQEMAVLPGLKLIACIGTGHEHVDVAEARRRGIAVSSGAGANAETVADHAFALLLSSARQIPALDAGARRGAWRHGLPALRTVYGKKLGLLGFGAIGQAVARRAAGFGMSIRYFSRTDHRWPGAEHCSSVRELARTSDMVICSLPGSQELVHIVDRIFLAELGPLGLFVNVGRGSLVNTVDLAAALRAGLIGAAALDVYETEPEIPGFLVDCPNLVLSPHVAGISPAAETAQLDLLVANIEAALQGRDLPMPVR